MSGVAKIKLTTTFQKLHAAGACKDSYRHLAKALGGITKYGRTKPINLLQILEHNGAADFFWTVGQLDEKDSPIFRLMGASFAESVLGNFESLYPNDSRPRDTIAVIRRFARGEATMDELSAADRAHLLVGPAHRCQPARRLTSLILHLRYIDGADTDVVTGPVGAASQFPGCMGACPTIF